MDRENNNYFNSYSPASNPEDLRVQSSSGFSYPSSSGFKSYNDFFLQQQVLECRQAILECQVAKFANSLELPPEEIAALLPFFKDFEIVSKDDLSYLKDLCQKTSQQNKEFNEKESVDLDQSSQMNQAIETPQQSLPATVVMLTPKQFIELTFEKHTRHKVIAQALVENGMAQDFSEGWSLTKKIFKEEKKLKQKVINQSPDRKAARKEYDQKPKNIAARKAAKERRSK